MKKAQGLALVSACLFLFAVFAGAGCASRPACYRLFVKTQQGRVAVRVLVASEGREKTRVRVPSTGLLPGGRQAAGRLTLREGDEVELKLEGSGRTERVKGETVEVEPAALVAVCPAGTKTPAGWYLLQGPCSSDWPQARYRCTVGSREWREFLDLCSAPRKRLPAHLFRVGGVRAGDTRERLRELLGPPAQRIGSQDLPFGEYELWAYPEVDVYLEKESSTVDSLALQRSHGGVEFGESYAALVEEWGWPDRVEPTPYEGCFVAVYDRPEGRAWWVIEEGRIKSAWLGECLAD